jgi:ATP-dependent RNA helicase SUPV3L1/SUV3
VDRVLSEADWRKGVVVLKKEAVLPLEPKAFEALMLALGYMKLETNTEASEGSLSFRPKTMPQKKAKPVDDYINPYSPFAILRATRS